jgi:hypothetical protein
LSSKRKYQNFIIAYPDAAWRSIMDLSRYEGIRRLDEELSLRRDDVLWNVDLLNNQKLFP